MTEEDYISMWKSKNDRLRKALIAAKDELTGILNGTIKRQPGIYMAGNNRALRQIRSALKEP